MLVSNKVLSGKKCFKNFIRKENEAFWKKYAFVYNAYKNECLPKRFQYEKNMLLCIVLTKMSAYRRDFDETLYMSFMIKKITNC